MSNNNQSTSSDALAIVNTSTSTVALAQNETVKERFYPTITKIDKADVNQSGQSTDADRGFVITQELVIKLHLIDKYNMGVCYGMPAPVSDDVIADTLSSNPSLVKFLTGKYDLPTDLDVYNKIKQINAINLIKIVGGKYNFSFIDGECCTLASYQGTTEIIGSDVSDTVIDQQIKHNPC